MRHANMNRASRLTSVQIIGQDPAEQLSPQVTGHMMSGIAKELADDSPYTLTHAERMKKSRDQTTDEKV